MTEPHSAARRSRRRGFRLAAVGLALLVVFGLPELSVRWFGPDHRAFTAMRFGGDPASEQLFVRDPVLHWRLRADADVRFLGVGVATDAAGARIVADATKASRGGSRLVLCLGDSTTFGWGVEARHAFPHLLEDALRRREPDAGWCVHNAGVPGYSSHQLRLVGEDLIPRLAPAAVVVCIGNNDAWPVRRSDRAVHEGRGLGAAIAGVLQHSAFLTVLADALRGSELENPAGYHDEAVPRVGLDDLEANLERVFALARGCGASVHVIGPPANLQVPPKNFDDVITARRALGDAVYERIVAKDVDGARALLDAVEPGDDRDAVYLDWLRAMVIVLAVDASRGREQLEQVFERHPFPDRARRSYRARQRAVAEAAGVPFVDANELFRDGRGAEQAQAMYLDWCHPSVAGHQLMASRVLSWLTR